MHFDTRSKLRDRLLLVLLAAGIVGLMALVYNGRPWPRLFASAMPPAAAGGRIPPVPPAIHRAEMKDALTLQAAFDRIGFDLDSVAAGYISVPRVSLVSLPANLGRLDGMDEKKGLFLRALLPIVLAINDAIAEDRAKLDALRGKMRNNETLSGDEVAWVMALADAYDQPDADLDALAKKVDVIPPSLALAQAIEESGWGTSRIARTMNALFGQFGQADGVSEAKYMSFASLSDAVEAYARNLNTHRAYREFREKRARMRGRGEAMSSDELAGTLHRYSERGGDYVTNLRSIIHANDLTAFDGARLSPRRADVVVESRAPVVGRAGVLR